MQGLGQRHDATGCPILFCGKPKIYEHLGFRKLGEFSERLDQIAGRIAIRRDLTERTRGANGEPLYTRENLRAMIRQSGLKLVVSPDAEKWLQSRASTEHARFRLGQIKIPYDVQDRAQTAVSWLR